MNEYIQEKNLGAWASSLTEGSKWQLHVLGFEDGEDGVGFRREREKEYQCRNFFSKNIWRRTYFGGSYNQIKIFGVAIGFQLAT